MGFWWRAIPLLSFGCCGHPAGAAAPPIPPAAPPTATVQVPPAASAAPSATSTAPAESVPPPLPPGLDGSLPVPHSAQIVALGADGSVLLSVDAWVEGQATDSSVVVATGGGTVRSNTSYLAVLDAKHDCLEQAVRTDTLDAAGATGTVPEALAILRTPAANDELARLWTLAKRFGERNLGAAVFGVDDGFALVQANDQIYVHDAAGHFTPLPGGTSSHITASPDGTHVALARCGSPCGGVYVPVLLDTRTRQVRRFPVGNAHDFHFTPDGQTLYFSYDDSTSGVSGTTKVCLGRVDGDSPRVTPVRCYPSRVRSTEISAASPGARFIGMLIESDRNPSSFAVLEMPTGREALRIGSDPIYADLDDRGRVAWDDGHTPGYHPRVRVASAAGEQTFPDARSVGFLADGSVLVMPDDHPTYAQLPIRTLADRHCGFFETRATSP